MDVDALARPSWPLQVRVFDSSTLPGLLLTFGVLALGVVVAYVRLPHDDYQALMCLSFVLLLLPVFLTGRCADFPRSPAEQALPWFRFLQKTRLGQVRTIELWGRHTSAAQPFGPVDEVRLRVVLERPPSGLRALEIAFEEGPGAYLMPCIVLRVIEDSPARERLPDIGWTRGRQSEEKTAVVHPPAPTRGQLLRLLRSLLAHLLRPAPAAVGAPVEPVITRSVSPRSARPGAAVRAAPSV